MSFRTLSKHLINRVWIASCSRANTRFADSLNDVAGIQQDYLLNVLAQNAQTEFGRKHRFAEIRSIAQYQKQVPLTDYESLSDDIRRIADGAPNVLTADRVRLLHPTSGSQSATKLIPWTATVACEFQQGIAPWLVSLYRRKPRIMQGTAYWSISPPSAGVPKAGKLQVGFDDDAKYLGFFGRRLFPLVNAVSSPVANSPTIDQFKERTLAALVANSDLTLISVWSPTFLTVLMEELIRRRERIADLLLQSGAKRQAAALKSLDDRNRWNCETLWPSLQVISCWTHGSSSLYAENLRAYFPKVEIQGKGLVATEAFVSLPYAEDKDPALAVTSHFFEFQDAAGGATRLAHELEQGGTYRVIVTTGGGLYRYQLWDLIEVTGFIQQTPCLRFLGREGDVSDLFGEKLSCTVVEAAIKGLLSSMKIRARFFLLAPVTEPPGKTSYTLFIEADELPDAPALAQSLDTELRRNFHYAHCRQIGQLSEPRIFLVSSAMTSPEAIFQQALCLDGLRLGNIKMTHLDRRTGWEKRFAGQFLA